MVGTNSVLPIVIWNINCPYRGYCNCTIYLCSFLNELLNFYSVNSYRNLLILVLINIFVLLIGLLVIELVFGSWLIFYNNLHHLRIDDDKNLEHNLEGLYETQSEVIN